MEFSSIRRLLTIVTVAFVICMAASASTITYSNTSGGYATTNFGPIVLNVPKFDTLAGTLFLNSVTITLNGFVQGNAQFESLDAAPATVTMNLAATLTLKDPSSVSLVVVIPTVTTVDSATAFDGVIDFGGTSGNSYLGETGTQSHTTLLNRPANSTEMDTVFSGTGNVALQLLATGASNGSGAGNLALLFRTDAKGDISVTYDYTDNTAPEPATMALLGSALLGLGLMGRKRFTNR